MLPAGLPIVVTSTAEPRSASYEPRIPHLRRCKAQSRSASYQAVQLELTERHCLRVEGRKPLFCYKDNINEVKLHVRTNRMIILKEDVDLANLNVKNLTNDCKFVRRASGEIDLVREYNSVRIFDHYWDRGIKILKIWHSGGTRNPKFQQPEF
jgi:hypothetical protein